MDIYHPVVLFKFSTKRGAAPLLSRLFVERRKKSRAQRDVRPVAAVCPRAPRREDGNTDMDGRSIGPEATARCFLSSASFSSTALCTGLSQEQRRLLFSSVALASAAAEGLPAAQRTCACVTVALRSPRAFRGAQPGGKTSTSRSGAVTHSSSTVLVSIPLL
uniref:Uncharacterized protein n=1 Tax=Knipowitschia caucasica TaxID=637954 RepID=A0AAV2J0F3_KNICA